MMLERIAEQLGKTGNTNIPEATSRQSTRLEVA
jgi:hypothetical protein